jgi:hypothetical protein
MTKGKYFSIHERLLCDISALGRTWHSFFGRRFQVLSDVIKLLKNGIRHIDFSIRSPSKDCGVLTNIPEILVNKTHHL